MRGVMFNRIVWLSASFLLLVPVQLGSQNRRLSLERAISLDRSSAVVRDPGVLRFRALWCKS